MQSSQHTQQCVRHESSLDICTSSLVETLWRRPIGCLKLQVIFRNRATDYRALLRKMTYTEMVSCGPWPPCISSLCVTAQKKKSSQHKKNWVRHESSLVDMQKVFAVVTATQQWLKSHVWMSHVTHTSHTRPWVTSHTRPWLHTRRKSDLK